MAPPQDADAALSSLFFDGQPHFKGPPLKDELDGFAVLLVDDHPLFRDGLTTALRHQAPGLHVQAVATVDQALDMLSQDCDAFDLVLLDYRLLGNDGLHGAERLRAQCPDLGIGLISGVDDPARPQRAQDTGLKAYLPKTLELPMLLTHLRRLATGETVFEGAALTWAPDPDGTAGLYGLTERQMNVLRQLATGASNKQIARALGISPATVKNHLETIFVKMGAANRMQAVMMARDALERHGG